jgi:V-type H+-transporting ATPase subunit H
MYLYVYVSSAPSPASVDLSSYFSWVAGQLQGDDLRLVDLAVQELESVLRVREYRLTFWNTTKAPEA